MWVFWLWLLLIRTSIRPCTCCSVVWQSMTWLDLVTLSIVCCQTSWSLRLSASSVTMSVFKLSCESVVINNVYGLTYTVVLYIASVGSMVLTYTHITGVCLTQKNKSLNKKALKTCSTHLVVYLIMACCGLTVITLHRFPQYSEYRKFFVIIFIVGPRTLNPIIYGVQSKE